MELIASESAFVIIGDEHRKGSAVYCCRHTGRLSIVDTSVLCQLENVKCLGLIKCLIGRISAVVPGDIAYLLVVSASSHIGFHPLTSHEIFRIDTVAAFPLATSGSDGYAAEDFRCRNLHLSECHKHKLENSKFSTSNPGLQSFLQKGQKKLMRGTVDSFRFVTNRVQLPGGGKCVDPVDCDQEQWRASNISENSNRKLLEEILKLFNAEQSFYYCAPGGDLTNSMQRLSSNKQSESQDVDVHYNFDCRFFWNMCLLEDLWSVDSGVSNKDLNSWIVPVVQGFVAIHPCFFSFYDSSSGDAELILISRRSIRRAGTRYIKRGIDSEGNCANYVETEQILRFGGHCLAFVQVRGSVPLFWHQSGYKYRPPPRIEKGKDDSIPAFKAHVEEQASIYGSPLVMINLTDQSGREAPLGEAFLDHAIDYDSDSIIYVAFDFHDHCKGLRLDRVETLINAISDSSKDMRFAWVDKRGALVCRQNGVNRVNCVDCLDRTNVVQTALARSALHSQLLKLGVVGPGEPLPRDIVPILHHMWADNGDSISHQYAGTAALKGDLTRRGERNLAGLFRDGYHSASRYYLCHVRDSKRQAAINVVLGKVEENSEIDKELAESSTQEENEELHEDLRMLVQEVQRFFLPESEILLGGWALIDADPGTGADFSDTDMNVVVLLTRNSYYCAEYDEDMDKFVDCKSVPLSWIVAIETGRISSRLKKRKYTDAPTCLRIYYSEESSCTEKPLAENCSYFHVWRAASTRLFNNMAIPIKSIEEADEYVRAIAEQFRIALELSGSSASVTHHQKLQSKKSRQINWKEKGKIAAFFSDVSGARETVRAKLRVASWNPLRNLHTKIPEKTCHKIQIETQSLCPAQEYSKTAVSVEAGLLFSQSPALLEVSSGAIVFPVSFVDDMALLRLEQRVVKPTFTLETEEVEASDTSHLPAFNSIPPPTLPLANSCTSLRVTEQLLKAGGSDEAAASLKTSKSEGMLGCVLASASQPTESTSSHFINRLTVGSGKFLGITSSFSKLTSQVQTLGNSAQKTFWLSPRSSGASVPIRKSPFETFRNRISSSRTKVILL